MIKFKLLKKSLSYNLKNLIWVLSYCRMITKSIHLYDLSERECRWIDSTNIQTQKTSVTFFLLFYLSTIIRQELKVLKH